MMMESRGKLGKAGEMLGKSQGVSCLNFGWHPRVGGGSFYSGEPVFQDFMVVDPYNADWVCLISCDELHMSKDFDICFGFSGFLILD